MLPLEVKLMLLGLLILWVWFIWLEYKYNMKLPALSAHTQKKILVVPIQDIDDNPKSGCKAKFPRMYDVISIGDNSLINTTTTLDTAIKIQSEITRKHKTQCYITFAPDHIQYDDYKREAKQVRLTLV